MADGDGQDNPVTLSDDQTLDQILETHCDADSEFDVDSLFNLVQNVLKPSTHLVDNVLQGSQCSPENYDAKTPRASFNTPLRKPEQISSKTSYMPVVEIVRRTILTILHKFSNCAWQAKAVLPLRSQGSPENYDAKGLQASFKVPLGTLKQISYEMSSKSPVVQIAHKTTLTIFRELSNYSWQAKAVLTLAAFTLDYGDFYILSQHQSVDPVAKSLAILKRALVLTSPAAVQKYQQDIVQLNNLIKTSSQVIEMILELDNLSSYYTIKDFPTLALALDQIPVDVYWTVITIVVCVTQIDCLTTESEERQDLSYFGQKTNVILSKLKELVFKCRKEIREVGYYSITDVLKVLYLWKDAPQIPIYDGATKTLVTADELKCHVFLFISNLDITEEEIDVLRPFHEHIELGRFKITAKMVWIPMVEKWTEPLKERFEILKSKMPWFVVQYFGTIKGFQYIKERWHYEKEPMVVSTGGWGVFGCTITLQEIRRKGWMDFYGFSFFQYHSGRSHLPGDSEGRLPTKEVAGWLWPLVKEIDPDMTTLGERIFIYGGKDREWLREFARSVTALQQDPILEKDKISIKLFCIEWRKNFQSHFWSIVEELSNEGIQEAQETLSYKNEASWALLIDYSTVILQGRGTTILKTVKQFEKWKDEVIRKGFDISFKEQHRMVAEDAITENADATILAH